MGKGSYPRPINKKRFDENFDSIFRKNKRDKIKKDEQSKLPQAD